MRTPTNKARTVDPAVCPQCGRESTSYGCRAVPLGWWCVSAGLQQDPATFLHSTRDPDPAATDPMAAKARSEEAKAQRGYDEAHAAWVDSVVEQRSAELKVQTSLGLFTADWQPVQRDRDDDGQRRLRDAEEEARAVRDSAGDRLVEARQQTRAAEVAARRRRERT